MKLYISLVSFLVIDPNVFFSQGDLNWFLELIYIYSKNKNLSVKIYLVKKKWWNVTNYNSFKYCNHVWCLGIVIEYFRFCLIDNFSCYLRCRLIIQCQRATCDVKPIRWCCGGNISLTTEPKSDTDQKNAESRHWWSTRSKLLESLGSALCCDTSVPIVWLGLSTKNTWLWLGKRPILA